MVFVKSTHTGISDTYPDKKSTETHPSDIGYNDMSLILSAPQDE